MVKYNSALIEAGKEKKWCIQFHSGNLKSATIYFDEVDARKFKEKVNESLEGL
jgi:hypothetical protein